MKRSTLKAMRPDSPENNTWLAMLGPCVAVPHGREMARLVANCARVRELQSPVPTGRMAVAVRTVNRRIERKIKRRIAPRLVALLFNALANLDPQPLENLARVVRLIKQYNSDRQPAFPFHDKAARVIDLAQLNGEPLLTRKEVLERMAAPKKEHDSQSFERRELKRLGRPLAPDKRGPKKGTRKRGT